MARPNNRWVRQMDDEQEKASQAARKGLVCTGCGAKLEGLAEIQREKCTPCFTGKKPARIGLWDAD